MWAGPWASTPESFIHSLISMIWLLMVDGMIGTTLVTKTSNHPFHSYTIFYFIPKYLSNVLLFIRTAYFGVYKCWGPGSANVRGVSWARELDFESAHRFLVKSFVNGRHWIAPSDA